MTKSRGKKGRFAADLHMHSTCSDGELSPTQLVALAHRRGVETIAITDHDTAEGLPEALNAAADTPVRVISGVELTAFYDREVHILGFFFDPSVPAMKAQFERQTNIRQQRVHDICAKLAEMGVDLDADEILSSADGNVGRPHIAQALLKRKYVSNFNEAFQKYLGRNAAGYVDVDRISAEHAIDLIHGAGGVAVIAHPGVEKVEGRLNALKEMGLDGVEINHPAHKGSTKTSLKSQANRLGLLVSGGSDLHRRNSPCKLGDLGISSEELDQLRAAANVHRSRNNMADYDL
jgi:predicted metal-dependent phosphoesterase TrpH